MNIKLSSITLSNSKCPLLTTMGERIENISLPAILPDELRIHPTKYDILSESLYGNKLHYVYYGPGPDVKIQVNPILKWAEELRNIIINNCK
jgi:hypothetical protein